MNIDTENIFAIPSKDRLNDETVDLLAQAGIDVQIPGRQLSTEIDLPEVGKFTVALMRPKDIVRSVATGKIPLGIAGLDTVEEYGLTWMSYDLNELFYGGGYPSGGLTIYRASSWFEENNSNVPMTTLMRLGIGQSRLVLATQAEKGFQTEQDWWDSVKFWNKDGQFDFYPGVRGGPPNWVNVATSYPGLTRRFLRTLTPELELEDRVILRVKEMSGAVEVAPAIGLADAITDLVESGTTLKANGLTELTTIFESEAVLITNAKIGQNRLVDSIADRLFLYFLDKNPEDALNNKYTRWKEI